MLAERCAHPASLSPPGNSICARGGGAKSQTRVQEVAQPGAEQDLNLGDGALQPVLCPPSPGLQNHLSPGIIRVWLISCLAAVYSQACTLFGALHTQPFLEGSPGCHPQGLGQGEQEFVQLWVTAEERKGSP